MTQRIKPHLWFTLYTLLQLGASKTPVQISTTELSKNMGSSQQSASRHLQLLENMNFLERKIESGGSKIKITEDGLTALNAVLHELKWHIEGKEANTIKFRGQVISGLFEGAYYISKEGYRNQIIDKLGFDPFPGTLNVKIKEEELDKRRKVERGPSIRLEGFKDGNRAFGPCRCYPLTINGETKGAMIVAERTTHDETTLEIISPIYLRRHLALGDGDKVTISFLPLRRSDV